MIAGAVTTQSRVPYREDHVGPNANGNTGRREERTRRAPRRIVLLEAGEESDIARVLAEYDGAEVTGNRVHEDVQRFAAEHPGRHVAAEWLGPLGWTRFLWCRKGV
jgi:hypothetical protein